MKKIYNILIVGLVLIFSSCSSEFLELDPRGTQLETNFYQTEEQVFQGLVAVYDVLQWGGTDGWTMKLGLLNAASDDTYAGGSDASDQPTWVAWDNFTLDPFLGPQQGLWNKNYTGIYRANLLLEKIAISEDLDETFVSRITAETKFLRAFFYFDQVRLFGRSPLITTSLVGDEIYTQVQSEVSEIYAFIESDLNDARNTFELPSTVPPNELGRITQGAVSALLGKAILFQNDEARMAEAAQLFEEVINSGIYQLEPNFEDIFKTENEFGIESVFEIQFAETFAGGWEHFNNQTEGNYDVQFFGMRDYVGPNFATGWSFCPITEKLVDLLRSDPRFQHTIIDGNLLRNQGASYTEGFQNTNFFIRKYAGISEEIAPIGEVALNWRNNVREIRYADVLLMAAETHARSGNPAMARTHLNAVRNRVGLQPVTSGSGDQLVNFILRERQLELATEGHRFFDLVRSGNAATELDNFIVGKNELLPIPQTEIDITLGSLQQNPGY